MKRYHYILLILVFGFIGVNNSSAQTIQPQWAFQIGGQGSDRGVKLMADLNNNVYFSGTFEKTACLLANGITDSITSFGQEDIVFGRISVNGQLIWIKHIGGKGTDSPTDIMINANGDVFLSGIFQDTLNFETNNLISKDYIDSFIAKYDSLGNILWIRQISGLGSEHCVTMICDLEGDLLCGGFFNMTLEFPQQNTEIIQSQGAYDGFLAKWSDAGALLGTRVIAGSEDNWVKDVIIDNNNRYYTIGTFTGMMTPDTTQDPIYSMGGKDAFIARYNHQGDLLWLKTVGSILDDNAKCLTLGGNDKMIMTGEFKEDLYHDGDVILSSTGGNDIFHLKFNKNGTLQHCKKHGKGKNDFVFDAWIPVGQKIMMASDLKNFDDNRSITLANYEMLGNLSDIIETSTDFNPLILSAVMPQPDTIYFCGNFHDTVAFGQYTMISKGQADIFIIKLAPENDSLYVLKKAIADTLEFPVPPVAMNADGGSTFYTFPNPFRKMTQLIYTLPQTCTVQIEVTDMKGNTIKEWQYSDQSSGTHTLDFNGEDLKKGVYQVRLYATGETISILKVIKMICLN